MTLKAQQQQVLRDVQAAINIKYLLESQEHI